MSNRIELIDQIKSSTSTPIKVGTKATYVDSIVVVDLTDNDIPDWAAVNSIIVPAADPFTQFIPAGSDFPFVVDYTGLIDSFGETPTPLFYDALTGDKRQWTDCYITFSGTDMLVWCHTNEGTTTSDDMYLILKV